MTNCEITTTCCDMALLDEIRRAMPDVAIRFLLDDELRQKLTRHRLRRLLDEMEANTPITEEERRRGDELWEKTVSFWT